MESLIPKRNIWMFYLFYYLFYIFPYKLNIYIKLKKKKKMRLVSPEANKASEYREGQ